jgi:hypothetical protein
MIGVFLQSEDIKITFCCQSFLSLWVADVELKISFSKDLNGTCSTEAITKGVA